jgi:hypothetical protein
VNPLRFEPWYHKGLAFVYLREFGKQYGLDLLPLNPKDTKKIKGLKFDEFAGQIGLPQPFLTTQTTFYYKCVDILRNDYILCVIILWGKSWKSN